MPSFADQIRLLQEQAQHAAVAPMAQGPVAPHVDPALALVQAYQAYRAAHGGAEDPLAARAAQGPQKGSMEGARLLTGAGGAEPFQVTSHGARAGQTRQSYSLGDGRVAHVYYTPAGKRKVFVFTPGAA